MNVDIISTEAYIIVRKFYMAIKYTSFGYNAVHNHFNLSRFQY